LIVGTIHNPDGGWINNVGVRIDGILGTFMFISAAAQSCSSLKADAVVSPAAPLAGLSALRWTAPLQYGFTWIVWQISSLTERDILVMRGEAGEVPGLHGQGLLDGVNRKSKTDSNAKGICCAFPQRFHETSSAPAMHTILM
jgi:hypothetical protein